MRRRTIKTIGALAMFLAVVHACTRLGDGDGDGRLGELGKVRFSGPGGCDSSTTLALGSSAVLTLEPQEGALPSDLSVRSSAPAIIEATGGGAADEIVLEARDEGEAEVELVSAGDVYDWLGFESEPVASVTYTASGHVFAGGLYTVRLDDVLGACGEDCPLIGGEFMVWRPEPADALVYVGESERVARFTAGASGAATLSGEEPASGAALVDHGLTVHDTGSAGDLDVRIVVYLPSEELLDPQPPPLEVPAGSLVQLQFFAPADGAEVPVLRTDVVSTVTGDAGVLEVYDLEEFESLEGPIFAAAGAGSVSVHADVALIDRTGDFDISVIAE